MRQLHYDPTVGRFTQQDPIWDPLDPKLWNRYVYVGNDPINFIDPTGLGWWDTVKCVGGEMFRGAGDFLSGAMRDATTISDPLWFIAGLGIVTGAGMILIGAGAGGVVLVGSALLLVGLTAGAIALDRAFERCSRR